MFYTNSLVIYVIIRIDFSYVRNRDGHATLDVIQDKSVFLRRADFVALSEENVKPITILQRVGDVVVVPGCAPHQVNIFHLIIYIKKGIVGPKLTPYWKAVYY